MRLAAFRLECDDSRWQTKVRLHTSTTKRPLFSIPMSLTLKMAPTLRATSRVQADASERIEERLRVEFRFREDIEEQARQALDSRAQEAAGASSEFNVRRGDYTLPAFAELHVLARARRTPSGKSHPPRAGRCSLSCRMTLSGVAVTSRWMTCVFFDSGDSWVGHGSLDAL